MKIYKIALLLLCFTSFHANAEQSEDSFRWLEEESSGATQKWISEQQTKTDLYFSGHSEKERLKHNLEQFAYFDSFSLPEIREKGFFLLKLAKDADKSSLVYYSHEQEESLIMPPPSEQGAVFTQFTVSRDGAKIAYGISYGGTDLEKWFVYDLKAKKKLPDVLEGILFSSPVWSVDGNSLFYIHEGYKLCQHHLGSSQKNDALLFKTEGMHDEMLQLFDLTEKGDYLVFSAATPESCHNAVVLWDFAQKKPVTCLEADIASNQYVGEVEGKLLVLTNQEASYRKLIALDPNKPFSSKTLVREENQVLENVAIAKDAIVAVFYEAAAAKLKIYDVSGKFVKEVILPGLGSLEIAANPKSEQFFYKYTDFFRPPTLTIVNTKTGFESVFVQPKLPLNENDWITRQVKVKNRDGIEIPLFITHKKDLVIDSQTPVLLYGYGGFALSLTPHFSPFNMAWMQDGGVYVVANLRGGYEYGKEWYEAGRLKSKKNVFNDFIDAAKWLVSNEIGSSKTLAIRGQSNGGLLTAACLTMEPDLFGAVIVDKGVLDMLRFHLFTIGYMWISDYGDPNEPEDYAYLLSYSPYHNLKNLSYPATLVATADHDDRVHPAHSYKFTAALQTMQIGNNPVLLLLERAEGHKRGASRSSALSSYLHMLLFLKKELASQS